MSSLQIFMQREIGGWPLYTIVMAIGQMFCATSFQITLLSGQNWQEDWQLYILGGIFLVASTVWYALFRLKPSVWILTAPWFFFSVAFFLVGLPSVSSVFDPAHKMISAFATWSYAVASAAAFTFFGLNFGEEAGAATEVWALRACVVQGSQQLWVAALWYWGNTLNGAPAGYRPPWWVICFLWPLSAMCLLFAWCMAYGLPGKCSACVLCRPPCSYFAARVLPPSPPQDPALLADSLPSQARFMVPCFRNLA